MSIEPLILKSLFTNEEYCKKVIPYLTKELFQEKSDQIIFGIISKFITKYNTLPTEQAIRIFIEKLPLREDEFNSVCEKLEEIIKISNCQDYVWLVDETEEFGKEMSLNNAISESIDFMSQSKSQKGKIISIFEKALSFGFDSSIGHDYLNDYNKRYEYYTLKEHKIPFALEGMNKVTNGGFSKKTLQIFIGSTQVGKTLTFCSLAADYLKLGYDVLYISHEISEFEIAKRIDENLLNLTIDEIENISESSYMKKISNLHARTVGRLIIKEYPPYGASVLDYNRLLYDLELKQHFIPCVVIVDYLNLVRSSILEKNKGNYEYYATVSNELRGLGVSRNKIMISGTQFNREGMKSSQKSASGELTDISDSIGVTFNADAIYALFRPDNDLIVKQLKSRYMNIQKLPYIVLSLDIDRQKIFDKDSNMVYDDQVPQLEEIDLEDIFSDFEED